MEFIYLDSIQVIRIHDHILHVSGGKSGVLNLELLESVLGHVQNDDYYPTFAEKLTHLFYSVNKAHCFADGNKRTSIGASANFLHFNGFENLTSKFIIEMENIAVYVADNKIDKDLLSEIITSFINEDDYSEHLKLKIIDQLGSTENTGNIYEPQTSISPF